MNTMLTLPTYLEEKIMSLMYADVQTPWKQAAIVLSERYRQRDHKQYIRSHADALAYLALRFPATFAQSISTFSMIKEISPLWKPKSVLDIGAGPGTGILSASEIWPSLIKATAIEKESEFIKLGKQLVDNSSMNSAVEWIRQDVTKVAHLEKTYDLIIINSVLNEMDFNSQRQTLAFALSHASGLILVIEPGTPYGYAAVTAAAHFYERKNIPLPAPYIQNTIPESTDYWIHFAQRIKRPEFQRSVRQVQKDGGLKASDWEEVKFSFMAAGVIPSHISFDIRLIEDPALFKGFLEVTVLTSNGIEKRKILKRDKTTYNAYKKLKRGDIIITE